jgi:hypothetical protein
VGNSTLVAPTGCQADTPRVSNGHLLPVVPTPPWCRADTPRRKYVLKDTGKEGVLARKTEDSLFSDTEDGRNGRQVWAAMFSELAWRSNAVWAELESRLRPAATMSRSSALPSPPAWAGRLARPDGTGSLGLTGSACSGFNRSLACNK